MTKIKIFLLTGCTILLLGNCTGAMRGKVNVVKKRHAQFGIASLPKTWQLKRFRNADLFFEHVNKNAAIFLNSQCERFSDSPLEALTAQMLVGMGKYKIISQKRLSISGREALISEVNVKLDGINQYVKIMVLRKNKCVFDAVLSTKHYFRDLVDDFDGMLSSFWAEAAL
jgi:hypothetical protein